VRALLECLSQETPPLVTLRSKSIYLVKYGFGDASGKGFGSTFGLKESISYRIGVWQSDHDGESSNWREFTNVVESLEEEASPGRLENSMVFFFTDNSTAEAALYKGTSHGPKLFDLVIRVKSLETRLAIKLVVSHVSGLRMIAEGGDGVSRGILNEGVMAGEICSWMHMRKVSEDQRPCLRMVSRSLPLSFIAMAPPARSEWLLRRSAVKPQRCNVSGRAADFTAVLMCEESTCRVRPCAQQAERGVSRPVVKARISETRLAREQIGQWKVWMSSLCVTASFVPFSGW
jgi:hypothetical protein